MKLCLPHGLIIFNLKIASSLIPIFSNQILTNRITKSKIKIFILLIFLFTKPMLPQWVQTNGPNSGTVNSLVIHIVDGDSILFAGTSTGVFRTSDEGETWDSVNTGLTDLLTNKNVRALLSEGTKLFAGTYGGVFRFDNLAQTWDSVNTGLIDLADKLVRTLASKDSTIFAGTSSGVFYSMNNGNTWIKLSSPPDDIESIATMDSNIFASQGTSRDDSGIFVSSDDGNNWFDFFGGGRVRSYPSLAVVDTILIAGSVLSDSFGVTFFYYNGERWIVYRTNLYSRDIYSITVYNKLIFAVSDSGLYYSRDVDSNWINIGLENQPIWDVIIFKNYIFVGSEDGVVWKRPLSEFITYVHRETNHFPNQFILEQNYPNPFNPVTKIRYSISKNSYISLKVYNLMGEEITTLFEGFQRAGKYTATFNGNRLVSGVYLCRLQANNFVQTRKLVLLK